MLEVEGMTVLEVDRVTVVWVDGMTVLEVEAEESFPFLLSGRAKPLAAKARTMAR